MKKARSFLDLYKDFFIVLLAILCVLLPVAPVFAPSTGVDSSVFMYSGWRILNGEMPYVDLWDHKPPLVYYIDALGLFISGGSTWGIWILEFITLFLASFLGFSLVKKHFGELAAIISTYLWLINLFFLFKGGNLTEQWALPFQFGALFLFSKSQENQNKRWIFFVIGILGGLAFMTKQTAIGIWLAIGIFLLIRIIVSEDRKTSLHDLALMVMGVSVVILLVCGYFIIKGAWKEFWDVAFGYNFIYSQPHPNSILNRIQSFFYLNYVSRQFIFPISVLGIVSYLIIPKKKLEPAKAALLFIALIDVVFEIIFIHLRDNVFEHYCISLLPALMLFSGLMISIWETWIENVGVTKISKTVIALLVIIILSYGIVWDYYDYLVGYQVPYDKEAIQYVEANTQPTDSVYIWTVVDLRVNFYTKRICPTRFINALPLQEYAYVTEDMVIEFLDDLLEAKPALILDNHPVDWDLFVFPVDSQTIDEKVTLLMSQYEKVNSLNGWTIYKLIPK